MESRTAQRVALDEQQWVDTNGDDGAGARAFIPNWDSKCANQYVDQKERVVFSVAAQQS